MAEVSIQARARETECFATALAELARLLPDDDAMLEAALIDAARGHDDVAFTNLLLAALHAKRGVDARILEEGAALLPSRDPLISAGVHCVGDVGEALLRAVRSGRLTAAGEGLALVLIAWWSRERAGTEIPIEVVRRGRVLARSHFGVASDLVQVLDGLVGDLHLSELVARWSHAGLAEIVRESFENALEVAADDPIWFVPRERPHAVLSGYTVRRAVSRVGRNEPCPCGSGRKYKRCCFAEGQERLRHSSDVEGLTVEEFHANPEPHLTFERLDAMNRHAIARLDAARIDPGLLAPLANRLILGGEFDAAARLFRVPDRPELEDHYLDAVEAAADRRLGDAVRRLLAVRGTAADVRDQLRLKAWMLAEGLEPGPLLERIESDARGAVDDPIAALDLAHGLLGGPYTGLGILIARGTLWTANLLDGEVLLETLLEARDWLDLPPTDPVEDVVLDRWRAMDEDREARKAAESADEEIREELEAKLAEAQRLREDLRERDRALQRMERRLHAVETRGNKRGDESADPPVAEPETDKTVVAELRRRLAERKAELKRKHAERNALRIELERARHDADSLRARATQRSQEEPRDTESDSENAALVAAEDLTEEQPPRLPRFRRQFEHDLRRVPGHVARGALVLIGRLAAGDLAAFRGARRLRTDRTVWRQRVGPGYRLLFLVEDDVLEVVTLVTRQDFPRAVRSLVG